ncbi:PP2C family protein-serine/threonine phosphatase [Myxosarcina sp. GI1(2024)]
MSQIVEAMTVTPFGNTSQKSNSLGTASKTEANPILALKELVANLQREQNKVQDLLSSLGFALRSFSNLNQFLELTPLMAARVTDSIGGALILYKDSGLVRLEQIYCQDSQIGLEMRRVFEAVNNRLNQDINSKKAIAVAGAQLATDMDERIRQESIAPIQVFGTPVLVKNVERGRLYVFSTDPDYNWTHTRRKLTQLVADQTAVAIANHELTVELRSKERQDRELEIASEIQLRLLPSKCPQIEGLEIAAKCQTASRVGGDYYDFIPTNFDRLRRERGEGEEASLVPWSIVIGDVMGKGVPAGLIMTMTRGMLRAEVLNRHSPAEIMRHLNRVMYADLENSHRFVSMFYSEYDPNTKQLSFTNAAHNPPLLWRAATDAIEKLDSWGMLIGLDIDSEYEDAVVQLAPGDIVFYYTDGFTDAVNENGARFDEENLCRTFKWACQHLESSDEILEYIFNCIEEFSGSNNYGDDMTSIVMRIKK